MTLTTTAIAIATAITTLTTGYTMGRRHIEKRTMATLIALDEAVANLATQLALNAISRHLDKAIEACLAGDTATAISRLLGNRHPLLDQPMTNQLQEQLAAAITAKVAELEAILSEGNSRSES